MNPSSPNQPYNGGTPPPPSGPPLPPQQYPQSPPPSQPGYSNSPMPNQMSPTPMPSQTFDRPEPLEQPRPATPVTSQQPQPGPGGGKPAVKANTNSTQNALQIAEIRDGIVIMNDGSFRAVVMAKAINFDLMSQEEQEAVEFSYQGFLNSLYFPVQIFIHSQQIDLKPYISKLERLRAEHDNMLLALLIEDYVEYIAALSSQANIMDKEFYIVIPFFPHVDPQKAISQSKSFFTGFAGLFNNKEQHVVINEIDLENAKTELRNRVQSVLSALLQCGVQGLPLDTQELIELYYNTYNPDTATYQQLKGFNGMDSDVVIKGVGQAPQTHLQGELTQ